MNYVYVFCNDVSVEGCVCLTKFLQVFHFWHAKTRTHKDKRMSIDTHNLEVDTYCDFWRKKHTSINTLEIEMTSNTRQLKRHKLQLKYLENVTHNSRRTSHTHLHT